MMERNTDTTMVATHELRKDYGGFTALHDVSLTVRPGDIYGLVGRNGAGKTTLFKVLMGLAKPSGGSISLLGQSGNLNRARRDVGFMINTAAYPYLGARENLEYLARVKGITDKGEVERVLELISLAGERKPFKAFSMGMKQRLGLGAALLGRPRLVILDEPINGLDPTGIADIRRIILEANRVDGTTFIVSSHILSELDMVATRFGILEQGRLLEELTREELHAKGESLEKYYMDLIMGGATEAAQAVDRVPYAVGANGLEAVNA
jgi:ABC-2 type transport system ATP-binding protein